MPDSGRFSGTLPVRVPQAVPPPGKDVPPDPLSPEDKAALARRILAALLDMPVR